MGTDVNAIANLATQLANTRNLQAVSLALLKKALDIEKNSAAIMLQALESAPGAAVTSSIGGNIDTYA